MKDKYYYKDGSVLGYYDCDRELHRVDGPAVEYTDGSKSWWVDDKRHRVDGPAIEYADGGKEWWIDDKHHRVDGPAIEYANGAKYWYVDDKLHRVDGPAVEYNGSKEWWIDGKSLTEEEFNMHPKVEHHRFQILLEEVLSEG